MNRFDWLLYLDVANHLATQQGEGFYRSAASRACYGVFNAAREKFSPPSHSGGTGNRRPRNVHSSVINFFKGDRRLSAIGVNLDRLRALRIDADYDSRIFTEDKVQLSLILAQDILRDLADTER